MALKFGMATGIAKSQRLAAMTARVVLINLIPIVMLTILLFNICPYGSSRYI